MRGFHPGSNLQASPVGLWTETREFKPERPTVGFRGSGRLRETARARFPENKGRGLGRALPEYRKVPG